MLDKRYAYINGPWSIPDIVCLAVVGPLVLAAFLESFLWVAAFCYCLRKAYKKANHWSQKLLAGIVTVAFVILRGVFLPIMLVTLPLPARLTQHFPSVMIDFFQQFAFYSFAVMLIVPWLLCVYRLIILPLGRTKLIKYPLNECTAPKIVVVMPVYKEPPESLWKALNSVVECDYPAACIHVFVSFDGDSIDELYLKTIDRLGIPVTLKDFPRSIDVAYSGARVTVSRFPHGGKRHCQKATFSLIDKIYKRYLQHKDDLFILFIDSDCVLDPVCIQNFMYDMELRPGNKRHMLAMTGVITSCTEKNSMWTILQDMEYVHGQLFERSVESGCGAVTCLPGALTLLRFSAFRHMARFYFSDRAEECDDLFDYAKTHLGEDRWLTHLFMLGAKERYQIQLSTSAFCKTEAVQTFRSLLKQRRRWFLGFITNEVCMLTDARIWRKYPLLCLLRFMTVTVRTTALLFLITIISVATTSSQVDRLSWEFMCISLGLNWLLMLYFAIKLHRWKAVLYPVMFTIVPFLNWIFMVYGIFTAGQRTWGGPRADAGAADAKITPQEAIERAIATGDDLNVVPETFRPAIKFRKRRTRPSALLPSSSVEGRFVSADHEPQQSVEKGMISPSVSDVDLEAHPRRFGHDSLDMSDSEGVSIHTPQRVTSLSGDEGYIAMQDSEDNSQNRPTTISSERKQQTTGTYHSAESTATVVPIHQRGEDPDNGAQPRRTVSRTGPADPHELTRHLSQMFARQTASEGPAHLQDRSPLGRISPLTALPVEEHLPGLQEGHGVAESGNDDEAEGTENQASKRKRLRKRDASWADRV
ncbi:hypothetical protein PV05_02937 [Exophiala xenobiotica]|uniref:chitin synthase n=1 Tax=Exophiala xenobiotica TaxID=348802 RepID=A0A0D2EUH5_9EURO|nr:uncharacterized protein PV05_02937 [Exophiala xenobiotica]KIW58415.1 hypothetical protein PV05_02937 [Exophiala xenobiotica]